MTLLGGQSLQLGIDIAQILGAAVFAAIGTAVSVRCNDRMHPVRPGAQGLRVIGNRGGNRIGGHRPAVISLQHTEHVAATAVGPRQANRQVVGFGAAVDQEHPVHGIRRQLQQTLGELGDGRVMET
ncbi:hypothetical protein D3C79_811050 [compost metagenome]